MKEEPSQVHNLLMVPAPQSHTHTHTVTQSQASQDTCAISKAQPESRFSTHGVITGRAWENISWIIELVRCRAESSSGEKEAKGSWRRTIRVA